MLTRFTSEAKLFPNPATKFITLQYPGKKSQTIQIKIFDASGVLIKDVKDIFSAGQNRKSINVESLNKGMYFVEVQAKTGENYFQFLKE